MSSHVGLILAQSCVLLVTHVTNFNAGVLMLPQRGYDVEGLYTPNSWTFHCRFPVGVNISHMTPEIESVPGKVSYQVKQN